MVACACIAEEPCSKKKSPYGFVACAPPYSLVEVPFMAPTLNEDHVIVSNECKSVIITRSCLSISRSFYNMTVSAVTRALVFKYTLYVCVAFRVFLFFFDRGGCVDFSLGAERRGGVFFRASLENFSPETRYTVRNIIIILRKRSGWRSRAERR